MLVFNAPDTGYIKPKFIRSFRLQCKRGTPRKLTRKFQDGSLEDENPVPRGPGFSRL